MKCIPIPMTLNPRGEYEISLPGQLMYFTKQLGKAIPRDAIVRLKSDLDLKDVEDFKPIGAKREHSFLGKFYGEGHIIRNLIISKPGKKDISLFGTVGDSLEEGGEVYDLGVVDFDFTGSKNLGGIIGTLFGRAERCFCIGALHTDLDTNAMCAGGLAGKICCLEDGTAAVFRDCYANVQIDGAYAVGGLVGKDDGGLLENCWCAGTIVAQNRNGQAGGICGSFNAGHGAKNCVTMMREITGAKDIDKTVGQLEDEDGHQYVGVLAWDGMRLHGNPPKEQNFKWRDVSTAELQSKKTWKALDWDFKKIWTWSDGYPILRAFEKEAQAQKFDFTVPAAINFSMPHKFPKGQPMELTARVVSDGKIQSVRVHWQDKLGEGDEPMKNVGKGQYTVTLPPKKHKVFLTVIAETDCGTIGQERTYAVRLDSGKIKPEPHRICLTMGEDERHRRVNWVTDPRVTETILEYRRSGTEEILRCNGTAAVFSVTPGFRELAGHKAEFDALELGADYEYRVGDGENMSEWLTFRVTDPQNGYRFLMGSDSQSVTVEDYSTYVKCMRWYAAKGQEFAFSVMGGDISQDGYKESQWAAFFKASGTMFAQNTFVPVLGNHDMKGDLEYKQFKGHFNMPKNGIGGLFDETNYSFTYGAAAFYVINSEAAQVSALKEQIAEQMEWLAREVAARKAKWNIVLLHSGPYTANHDATKIRNTNLMSELEKLGIDLLLNGHDHLYVRTSMQEGKRVPLGQGVTYVTCGTVGNKFYEFLPKKAADFTEVFFDQFDRQILCEIEVTEQRISFTAWQKVNPKDKECTEFAICDSFVLQ